MLWIWDVDSCGSDAEGRETGEAQRSVDISVCT